MSSNTATTPVPTIDLNFDAASRSYFQGPATQAPISAQRICEMIIAAAKHQVDTAAVAKPILEAGLKIELMALIEQIAANAANPIALEIEDAISPPAAARAE